jgi:integrase
MPAQERHKTDYVGVYYIWGKHIVTGKPERIFYITYRKNGKLISEKAGRASQDMTPARANTLRSKKISGKEPTNAEKRQAEQAEKVKEDQKWTLERLWGAYKEAKPDLKGWKTGTYDSQWSHLGGFEKKEPSEITALDVKRLSNELMKCKSPQTVKHVLKLLRIVCNFGVTHGLCQGLSFKIEMPPVDNAKTEDLNPAMLRKLLDVISKDAHPHAGPMMLLALYTGMRRGELFRLRWSEIDFDRGFLHIANPKGGVSQTIPLNNSASQLMTNHKRGVKSPFVFPGRKGEQRTHINKAVNRIKTAAGLPKDFRPLHGKTQHDILM